MSNVLFLRLGRPCAGLAMLSCLTLPAAAQRATVIVTVAGTANPWLAGMPTGSNDGSDVAPDESPASVTGLTCSAGGVFTFAATGGVGYQDGVNDPPNGETGYIIDHDGGSANGISDVFAPADALVGVFLGAAPADPTLTPGPLDFSTTASQDASQTPALQQVFFIGSGLSGTGTVKQFVAPSQSARLFLGTMDGGGWYNNPGAFSVRVTGPAAAPEPSAAVALALGISGLTVLALKKRTRSSR